MSMHVKLLTGMRCDAQEAPHKLIKAIERAHGGLKDDTSIIVLDLLPPGKDFPDIAGRTKQATASKACMCFSP